MSFLLIFRKGVVIQNQEKINKNSHKIMRYDTHSINTKKYMTCVFNKQKNTAKFFH